MDMDISDLPPMRSRRATQREALSRVRLSLGGAIVGLSIAGIASNIVGVDRTLPDWLGAVIGWLLAFVALGSSRPDHIEQRSR